MIEVAPTIKSVRSRRFPGFDTAPSHSLQPLDCALGVTPVQAAKCGAVAKPRPFKTGVRTPAPPPVPSPSTDSLNSSVENRPGGPAAPSPWGDQRAGIVAGAIAQPRLAAPSASAIVASRVSCTAPWISAFRIPVRRNKLFDGRAIRPNLRHGLGGLAPVGAVIFASTGFTMTSSAAQFLQNLPHTTTGYPDGGQGRAATILVFWSRFTRGTSRRACAASDQTIGPASLHTRVTAD